MPVAGGVVVLGLEENSNEGLIEPIGSDWLVTDSISLPLGFSNQAAKASGQDPTC